MESKLLRNEIYIGENGVGKTKKLEEILKGIKPKKEENVVFIPTEQSFKDELEKEKSSGAGNFIYQIKILIQNIFGKIEDFDYELTDENLGNIEGRKKFIDSIDNFFKKISDDDFSLKTKDIIKDNKKANTILLNLSEYNTPSGKNNYSLIKILSELLLICEKKKISLSGLNDFYLLIDEPEKFCHPQLIRKIAIYLRNVSKHINVILTTHSPLFFSYYVDNEKTDIFLLKDNGDINEGVKINEILRKLKFNNDKKIYRVLNNKILGQNFIETLFSKKIIIVEDITTKSFVDIILEEIFIKNKKWEITTLISHGWNEIDDFISVYNEFGISMENVKIIVDNDGDKIKSYKKNGNNIDSVIYSFKEDIEKELDISGRSKDVAGNLISKIDKIKTTNAYKQIMIEIMKS